MREIKFRAWYKEIEYMEQNIFSLQGWIVAKMFKDSDSEYVPMQFTGLQDKNGKDIYEGDIINVIWMDEPVGSKERNWDGAGIVWCNAGFRIQHDYVLYDPGHAAYDNGDSMCDIWDDPDTLRIEVIGNIWETPELLGDKE